MNQQDESNVIYIDNIAYDVAELSDTCKKLLGDVQTANQAINLASSLVNCARSGAEATLKEARKLLPDPIADTPEVSEE